MNSAAFVVLISALAAGPAGQLMAPVPVGRPAPTAAVLGKLEELLGDALRQQGALAGAAEPGEGLQRVEAARRKYFDLQFPEALELARQSLTRFQAHPEELEDLEPYLSAHLFAALSLLALEQRAQAQEHFQAVLVARPDLRLPETEYSPDALTALERSRELVRRKVPGAELVVTSSPAFSAVRVDGVAAGEAPVTVRGLKAGWHLVQARREGHLPLSQWVEVRPRAAPLALTLQPDPAVALRAELAARVAAGSGGEVEGIARRLLEHSDHDALFLSAVSRAGDRYLVTGARVARAGPSRRAAIPVGLDLLDAPAALQQLARALAGAGADPTAGLEPGMLNRLDFDARFLGLGPEEPPPPPPPPALWKRPWFWGAATGVALAAGVGTYLLLRPQPTEPGIAVTLELPQ